MIQITADTRRAVVTNKELLTTGSAGIQVEFTLSEDWAGLAKVAVFRQGDEGQKVDVVLDSSLTCVVPPEVLTLDGEVVFIGVYGHNGQGTVIIPTIWASAGIVKPGTEPATPASAEPTPAIWAQILDVAQDAEETATEAMSLVESGLQDLTELEASVEAAESSRVDADQSRVTAENQRVDAENSRVLAENTRIANENERDDAETARAAAEGSRVSAENARASAETARVSAEQERVAAEQYREEKYAEYVETVSGYADNASASATAAAGSASNAANSATAAAGSASAAATSAQNASNSATAAAGSATTAQTAQSAAEDAQDAAETAADEAKTAVTHYPKIVDGYWYVWNAETETWVNTEIRAEGRDGYSPEVTITEIEGGHRVTITDEDHPQGQTFDVMDGQGGGSGTSDYAELENKPQINGHTLDGNQSASYLGLGTYSKPASGIPKTDLASDVQTSLGKADSALQTAPVTSVNSKTGAVTLGAGDVGYDGQATYQSGTVGYEVSELSRQLSDLDDDKQDAPSTAGTSGQVLALDDNLNPVWANQSGGGVTSVNGKTGAVTLNASDVGAGTYSKPSGGIPATDLASAVQTSLGKADTALQTAPVSSVAGKTGAVTLDAGDVEFDDQETYAAGSVGAELSSQLNAIEQKQDAPSSVGTAGQVLGLDSNLNPVWVDQTGGGGGGMNIVNLSGTQITQVGTDNTFYVCGELTELTFTAPAVGITMIRFTSGTTPTVLTVNGVTSWMFDNDPTAASLEANKTYEINVLNGVGVVGWA